MYAQPEGGLMLCTVWAVCQLLLKEDTLVGNYGSINFGALCKGTPHCIAQRHRQSLPA